MSVVLAMPAASIAQVAGKVLDVASTIVGLDALGFGEYQRERGEDTQTIDDAENLVCSHYSTSGTRAAAALTGIG